jgi:O-antigen ligase
MAGCAAAVSALVAAGLFGLPLKVVLGFLGIILIGSVAVMSGHLRAFLIGLMVLLVSLDVKTFPSALGYRESHFFGLGGAAGIVITAQFILLVPLFALALLERYGGQQEPQAGRLPAGSYWVPLLPVLATLPSLLATPDIQLSSYELLRMFCFYLLYVYFALELRRSEVPLVAAAFLVGLLLVVPFVLAELALPNFRFSVLTGTTTSIVEGVGNTIVKRVSGTMSHPNVLGGYLGLLWPIALLFAIVPALPRLRWPAAAVAVVSIPILTMTLCRGCWVGFAASIPIVVLLAARHGHISRAQASVILAVAGVAAALFIAQPSIWSRLVASDPGNVNLRLDLNEAAIMMWSSSPVTGVGLNLFPEKIVDYDVNHSSQYRYPVHNIYLLWLSETGILGAVGMALFLGWAFYRMWRAAASADRVSSMLAIGFLAGAVGLYVGELASFSTRLEPIAQAFFILLGAIVAISRTPPMPAGMPGSLVVLPPRRGLSGQLSSKSE